jgi:ribonuclease P protein component
VKYTVSLKDNRIFQKLYNRGKRSVSPYFALYYRKNGKKQTRIGITASTKLGKAVVRNRVRRRIREIIRLAEAGISPGHDIVIVARIRAISGGFQEQKEDLQHLLCACGLLSGVFCEHEEGAMKPPRERVREVRNEEDSHRND